MTVKITRLDHTARELRAIATRQMDAKLARRLLAVALVLEGRARAEAAQTCGMDRQTLRDWVIRYNEHGVLGLADRPHGGGLRPSSPMRRKRCWHNGFEKDRTRQRTALCAGDCAI